MKRLRVLIACECSQTVCAQFRAIGDECYSCDIVDQYGGHPEWHIMQDARDLPEKDRARARSKTFPGIAAAMATQWHEWLAEPFRLVPDIDKGK